MSLHRNLNWIGYSVAALIFAADVALAIIFPAANAQNGVPVAFFFALGSIKAVLVIILIRSLTDRRWVELLFSAFMLNALFAHTPRDWFYTTVPSLWAGYSERFQRLDEKGDVFLWIVTLAFTSSLVIAVVYFVRYGRGRWRMIPSSSDDIK